MSLLKRLGRTKEEAIKEVERRREKKPSAEKPRDYDTNQTYSRLVENRSEVQTQAASAFAGRRSAAVQIDQIQELRLAIHRRIVDERKHGNRSRT